MNIIQSVVADQSSSISHVQQEIVFSDSFYCDLILYENVLGNGWTKANDQQTIWPNKEYRFHISLSRNNSYAPRYESFIIKKIETEIYVKLICSEDSIKIVNTDSGYNLSEGKVVTIPFVVPQESPRCDVTFILHYYELKNKEVVKKAASKIMELKGGYYLMDQKIAEAFNLDLDRSLPNDVAMLYVEQQDEKRLSLHGWNRTEEPEHFESCGWETKKLADILAMLQSQGAEDVLDKIHEMSRQSPHNASGKLTGWFNRLHLAHGKHLCVVINEQNDLEIPWEVLVLDSDRYLGAQVAVVRWKRVGHNEWRRFRLDQVVNQGTVMTYFNQEPGTNTAYAERKYLQRMQRKSGMNARDYKDLSELQRELVKTKTLNDVGLIYLGCYCHEYLNADTRKKLEKEIRNPKLERAKYHGDPRPLVFVNAHNSARVDEKGNGPMDVWLTYLVSGYIGTCGLIEPRYASKVAKLVLEAKGLPVAEVLRQIRAEAVRDMLQDEENEEFQTDFIYAFMYVYYGDPFLSLDLGWIKEREENVDI